MATAPAETELEIISGRSPPVTDEAALAGEPSSPTAGIAIRELTAGVDGLGDGSDTHVLVVQPDGQLHVGVDIEKWSEVEKTRQLRPPVILLDARPRGLGWPGQATRLVLGLPDLESALLHRRFMLWYFLMGFQMALYIVILALCITITSSFSGPPGSSYKWNSGARRAAWLRDFTFPFGVTEKECVLDVVAIMALSVMGLAGAVLYSPAIMTFWILAALIILALGAATTLSPVIVLRLVYIVIAFQVRAGVIRWRFTHVGEQPSLRDAATSFAAALSCCWCSRSRQQQTPEIRHFSDVESGGRDGGPALGGDGVPRLSERVSPNESLGSGARLSAGGGLARTSLQLSGQVRGRHYGSEGELIWNNGLGLERDSVIMQNATRARVTVDAQGRRTLVMSGLGG